MCVCVCVSFFRIKLPQSIYSCHFPAASQKFRDTETLIKNFSPSDILFRLLKVLLSLAQHFTSLAVFCAEFIASGS